MLALLLAAPALAENLEVWTFDEFPNGEALDGHEGWRSGYDEDEWRGYYYRQTGTTWAIPTTDDSQDRGGFGEGGALDNWLVNEATPIGDGGFSTVFYSDDDDAFGIVIAHEDEDNFYLLTLCGGNGGDNADCPFETRNGVGILLMKVQDGEATLLDQDGDTYSVGDSGTIWMELNDGVLTAGWEEGGVELSAEDETFDHVDGVGFWAYNAGYVANENSTTPYFGAPVAWRTDDDDDGVADDEDNCEFDENEDQADADDDGIGTACDDEEVTDPGDSGDSGGDDSGAGGGGGGGGDELTDAEKGSLEAPGACGCDAGAGAVGLLPALLAGLGARRRRRG